MARFGSEGEVELTSYDYDKNETVSNGKVSLYTLAKSLKTEDMAYLLDDWLNSMNSGFERGKKLGLLMRETHRTLQGSLVNFVLGILVGISQQQYTDARNEYAIRAAKAVAEQIENGKLPLQPFI